MSRRLRVMCWNIAGGEYNGTRNSRLDEIAKAITDASPDLVLLSEARLWNWANSGVNQVQYLADKTGMLRHWVQTCYTGATGGKAVAVLSRYPLGPVREHVLARTWYGVRTFATLETSAMIDGLAHRVFSTRFDWDDENSNIDSQHQTLAMVQALPLHEAVILGGDFNAKFDGARRGTELAGFLTGSNLSDALPFGESEEESEPDHLFYRGPYCVTHWERIRPGSNPSDHPYVLADLWFPQHLCSRGDRLAACPNEDGRLEVFYIAGDGKLWHSWQTSPGGTWAGGMLGSSAKQVAVGRNQDGRLEVFYIGLDDVIYHNWQVGGGAWSGETGMDGWAKQIAVGQNPDGRLEVLYIGTDDKLYHFWQLTPSGAWSNEAVLGGMAKQLAVANNQAGRIEICYVGTDGQLYHNWKTGPDTWYGEMALGGPAQEIAVGQNSDERLELVYTAADSGLHHNWHVIPCGAWSSALPLGGAAKRLALARNLNGALELFYIGTDDRLYHNWQLGPAGGGWSGQHLLGGSAKRLAVARNQDGRLEVFYFGTDGKLYHNWQQSPSGAWNGEAVL